MEKVFEIYIRTTPERLWEAITDPEIRSKYNFGARITSDWTPGSRFEMSHPGGMLLGEGENLEVDPPRRLVQSMLALWGDDVKSEGTSRVTWEIEPVGDSCRLDRHARPAARGRQRAALRRLADDPLRPEDVARDRRAAHHSRLADVQLNARRTHGPAAIQCCNATRQDRSRPDGCSLPRRGRGLRRQRDGLRGRRARRREDAGPAQPRRIRGDGLRPERPDDVHRRR